MRAGLGVWVCPLFIVLYLLCSSTIKLMLLDSHCPGCHYESAAQLIHNDAPTSAPSI